MFRHDTTSTFHVILQLRLANFPSSSLVHVPTAHQVSHHRVLASPVLTVGEYIMIIIFTVCIRTNISVSVYS